VVDHLSQLPVDQEHNGGCTPPIDDSLPNEHLLAMAISNVLWYADLVNYLASKIVPLDLNSNQKE